MSTGILGVLDWYLENAKREGRICLDQNAVARFEQGTDPENAKVYAAIVQFLRGAAPSVIRAPPRMMLERGQTLYTVQPEQGSGCGLRSLDWFVLTKESAQIFLEFRRSQGTEPYRVCVYQLQRSVPLLSVSGDYPYTEFERWIVSNDETYYPAWTDYGKGDNMVVAQWIESHAPQMQVVGLFQDFGSFLVAGDPREVMLLNANEYLQLIQQAAPAAWEEGKYV